MLISIGKAAILLGVSVTTLRRWESAGKFISVSRTIGGHRRYSFSKIREIANKQESKVEGLVLAYARVSSAEQKGDLSRQKQRLCDYAKNRRSTPQVIEDCGSGLNFRKKGFKHLFRTLLMGHVSTLLLTHKDRLLRFGSEIIFDLCDIMGTKVIIIDEPESVNFTDTLAMDALELITVYVARLHGRRSHANRKEKNAA